MKERPIFMSAGSIRAILTGNKTQTRRVIKQVYSTLKVSFVLPDFIFPAREKGWVAWWSRSNPEELANFTKEQYRTGFACPYGDPGDHLWVRETWALPKSQDTLGPTAITGAQAIFYREANTAWVSPLVSKHPGWLFPERGRWRSPIHMPRWASRITLQIVNVRAERLQDISEDDAIAEGVQAWFPKTYQLKQYIREGGSYRNGYHKLWDALNGKRGYPWKDNPWVWVIEFRKV